MILAGIEDMRSCPFRKNIKRRPFLSDAFLCVKNKEVRTREMI